MVGAGVGGERLAGEYEQTLSSSAGKVCRDLRRGRENNFPRAKRTPKEPPALCGA